MRSFQDSLGRTWNLTVSVGSIRRVRESTDILLTELFDHRNKVLTDLSADVVKVVDVLWSLCRGQNEGVDADGFAEGLGGDALGEAWEALVRATADFFTSQEERKAIHLMIDKANQATATTNANLLKAAEEMSASQLVEKYSGSATNGQANAASTPTREPPVNST